MKDAADHTAVIHPILAAYIRWQIGFDLPPLIVTQPKQIVSHLQPPNHRAKRINNRFSQQCLYWVLTLALQLRFLFEMGAARLGLVSPPPL